ncbi:hypothetical protein DCS_01796 [Drechmeria coniospora]|uniref:Uncharacterized protein n=1 Tax=Drechmeria coniospora TaxID=98403 RepID=A0A151GUA5_DRECN|nr:hypothetical protein DCS_01796 [Drechmeria coniospora]KYK60658.1 hypothetical protein DCS_01796 [Drechmeria coniospora]ODA83343.1 hypothetical protein RJ55_01856 [Drechmeria coniospora]
MAPSFRLEPRSFTPPSDHEPLRVSFSTSCQKGRGEGNRLYPATHLQLSYRFEDGAEMFGKVLTARDVYDETGGGDRYSIAVPRRDVPLVRRTKEGSSATAAVTLHAWKGETYLGNCLVGEAAGLSFGDEPLAPRRHGRAR